MAKEADCLQKAVSKCIHRTLSGRKKCGKIRCTSNSSLERTIKQNPFKKMTQLEQDGPELNRKLKLFCNLMENDGEQVGVVAENVEPFSLINKINSHFLLLIP
ncbi:hypothetical protein XENORESO_000898 [Xenotaenia resolanae]|uniref:Uncharacterized protein n=1 Tax=Xenotaenia resolanae TaxID=208358 RepID=A0ABV0VQU9_9TELE